MSTACLLRHVNNEKEYALAVGALQRKAERVRQRITVRVEKQAMLGDGAGGYVWGEG